MSKQFKVLVPKPAASNANGTDVRLYQAGEIVEASESWLEEVMEAFVANDWAMELKVAAAPEPKRARKDDGTYQSDDPATPDVNEAWEGGEAPKKKAPAKRTTKRKTTKKT